ncbi:MAG: DUF1570 domain-containing protein [Candidatus Sumerlaeia bacterium]
MNHADNANPRNLWGRCLLWTAPVVLWLALTAGGAERTAAAPTPMPMATPAVLADVLRPQIYFNSIPRIHTTAHFQLVNARDAEWSERMGDMLELLYDCFCRDMKELGFAVSEPADPLTWLCFDGEKAFVEYARTADSFNAGWLREYYSPRTNRVALIRPDAMTRTVGIEAGGEPVDILPISHEATHQFSYSTGLFRRGVMYPVWLTEGVAMSFETDSARTLGLNKFNLPRMKQLVRVRRAGRMLPLGRFMIMTHFRPDEGHDLGDLYAQADGFFRFMLMNHGDQLRAYVARLGAMAPGRRSPEALEAEFAAAFGAAGPLEAEWNDYLDKVERILAGGDEKSPATASGAIAGLVTPVVNR